MENVPVYTDNIVNYRNKGDYFTFGSNENNLGISNETKTKRKNYKEYG